MKTIKQDNREIKDNFNVWLKKMFKIWKKKNDKLKKRYIETYENKI